MVSGVIGVIVISDTGYFAPAIADSVIIKINANTAANISVTALFSLLLVLLLLLFLIIIIISKVTIADGLCEYPIGF